LPLLLALDMSIVVIDAVYDELTSDMSCPKDRAVRAFIDANQPPFMLETTDIGQQEREKRRTGAKLKKNAGELAIVDFMSSDDGLRKYLRPGDPVAILFEDAGARVFNKPPHLHLISTVGKLRGLERVGVILSADAIIYEMTHPSKPDRRPNAARAFSDLPDGVGRRRRPRRRSPPTSAAQTGTRRSRSRSRRPSGTG
jgi:hypothetical protein